MICSRESTLAEATRDPQLEEQFAAITNRHLPVKHSTTFRSTRGRARLRQAASAEEAWLVDIPKERRHSVTSLVTEADFVQMSHSAFRRELAHWMRASHPRATTGCRAMPSACPSCSRSSAR